MTNSDDNDRDPIVLQGIGTLTKRGERVLVALFLLTFLVAMAIVGKIEGLPA